MNHHPRLRIVAPNASPEEAAAVVAALEQFMRQTASVLADAPPEPQSAWLRAALFERVARQPDETPPWL